MSIEDVKSFVDQQTWIFAKTYAARAPHEYIVRGRCAGTDDDFISMARFIQEHGIIMHFWGHPNRYLFLGEKYYWVMKDGDDDPTMIINRASIDDYHISVTWKGQHR